MTHIGHSCTALAGGVNLSCQLDFIFAHWSCYCPPHAGDLTVTAVHKRPEHLKDALKWPLPYLMQLICTKGLHSVSESEKRCKETIKIFSGHLGADWRGCMQAWLRAELGSATQEGSGEAFTALFFPPLFWLPSKHCLAVSRWVAKDGCVWYSLKKGLSLPTPQTEIIIAQNSTGLHVQEIL